MNRHPTTVALVGRSSELDRLHRLAGVLEEDPRPGLVLVSGDAGIGKTRLLDALLDSARTTGWMTTVGRCVDLAGSPLPYLPVSEAVGRLESSQPERMARLLDDYPLIARLVPSVQRRGGSLPDPVDRAALFDSVHAALAELGRERPLLLVFEDLHWADRSSVDLLTFLFARRFEVPVSVVVSYRSDDMHRRHPLRATATGWSRMPGVGRIPLGPLDDAAITQIVRQLHPTPLPPEQLAVVLERAEGNAFLAEELIASSTGTPGTVPRDLAGLLLARVEQLTEDARELVRAVSVAGRIGHAPILRRVTGMDADRFDQAVRDAVETNVLLVDGGGYTVRHALLGEAVRDDLLPGERARLHAAYVEALTGASFAGAAAELARHALAGGDDQAALSASVQAGDEATAVGGPDEALRHYELALDLLTSPAMAALGGVDDVEMVEKAVAAAVAAGRVHQAIAVVQRRLQRGRADPPLVRARLLVLLAEAALLADSPVDAPSVTAEALGLLPAEPPTALRARGVAVHAMALGDRHRDEEATQWAENALRLADGLGLHDLAAQVRIVTARISERRGQTDASLQVLEHVIEEARTTADPIELQGLYDLASIHFTRGDLGQALGLFRRAADRARQIGRPYAPWGADARIMGGLVAYQHGNWDLALELADTTSEPVPPVTGAALAATTMSVLAGRGDGAAALALLEQTRPWWDSDGVVAINTAAAAIDAYGDTDRIDDATSVHDDLVELLTAQWGRPLFQARARLSALMLGQLATASINANTERRLENVRQGADLLEAAEQSMALDSGHRDHGGPEGRAWSARARAEWLRLRWLAGVDAPDRPELVNAWETTVEAFDRYGHVFEWARSVARWSAARSNDPEPEVTAAVETATVAAQRLGAAPLLAELAAGRRQRVRGQLLTPREMEVLTLVVAGRSNRAIGQQLFITTKTASVHVSNIIAKLAVSSRTEATAEARRRGLVP